MFVPRIIGRSARGRQRFFGNTDGRDQYFDSGSRGGLCDHWDFRPGRTVRFHNRYAGPNLENGCRPGRSAPQADRCPLTPCPLGCHFWANNWKRRKGTWKPAARRAVGVERPRAIDSPLPETRQVLPAGSCWADHDDDASNSTAFSRHSPGRGKCGRSRRPQSRAATSCRLAAVTPPRRVGSGCNVLSSSSCHTAGARASAFELTAGALTASDGTGQRKNKLCRSGGSDMPHDSGGWFRNRCCDGHHGVLKE